MCERIHVGELIVLQNKCFNRQLSADNMKPLDFPPDAATVIDSINTFLIVARTENIRSRMKEGKTVYS